MFNKRCIIKITLWTQCWGHLASASKSLADFQLGLWKSTNSVGNLTKPSLYKRAESNLLAEDERDS